MSSVNPTTAAPIVWQPTEMLLQQCQMAAFMRAANDRHGLALTDYDALWRWSIDQPAAFWSLLWDFAGVVASDRCITC